MADFWAFLADQNNQQTLTWLGGGAVVAAGGLWTAIKFFWKPKEAEGGEPASSPQSGDILVDGDGNITGGTVNIDNSSTMKTGLGTPGLVVIGLLCVGAVLLGGAFAGSTVSADCGGLAVEGGISGSTISIQNGGSGDCE